MSLQSKHAIRRLCAGTLALCLSAGSASAEELRFWTTEEQPDRLAKQEAMAERFAAASGHSVEVIPVTEKDLGTRATASTTHCSTRCLGPRPASWTPRPRPT